MPEPHPVVLTFVIPAGQSTSTEFSLPRHWHPRALFIPQSAWDDGVRFIRLQVKGHTTFWDVRDMEANPVQAELAPTPAWIIVPGAAAGFIFGRVVAYRTKTALQPVSADTPCKLMIWKPYDHD